MESGYRSGGGDGHLGINVRRRQKCADVVGPLVFVAVRFWVAGGALVGLLCSSVKSRRGRFPSSRARCRPGRSRASSPWVTCQQTIGLQNHGGRQSRIHYRIERGARPTSSPQRCCAKPPPDPQAFGVLIATVGLGFLTLDPRNNVCPRAGDLWVLLCAVGFAAHITSTARFAPHYDVLPFTAMQLLTTAALPTMTALVFERHALLPPVSALPAIVYMALIATAFVSRRA